MTRRRGARGRAGLLLLLGALAPVVSAPGARAATFNVTTTADAAGPCGSPCSLRQAIIAANASAGPHTINLPAGTYSLTIPGPNEDNAATGDLDIRVSGISIVGAGAEVTIIQQLTADRVFDVNPTLLDNFSFSISGVTIQGGNAGSSFGGGGILYSGAVGGTAGTLTITNCVITGNMATGGPGGGIEVSPSGNLLITGSTISNNTTSGQGGGIDFFVQGAGNLTITNSTISENSAGAGGDAGGGLRTSGTAGNTFTIGMSQILNNHASNATGKGGGIVNAQGTLTITGSRIIGNTAAGGGSGLFEATFGGVVTASGDWWGINTGPGVGVLGNNPGASAPVGTPFLTIGPVADIGVYRSTTGEWFILRAADGGLTQVAWGAPPLGDVPVAGDYDGNGRADIAVYRGSTGEWFILRSSDGGLTHVTWGSPALQDIPVPGDYDGVGRADIAVYRGLTSEWFILRASDGGLTHVTWGSPALGDIPVPGDYDGDGRADIAVYRGSTSEWFILRSSDGGLTHVTWGSPALRDVPVPARY